MANFFADRGFPPNKLFITTSTRYWIKSMTGSGKELISRTIGTRSVTWQVNFRTETQKNKQNVIELIVWAYQAPSNIVSPRLVPLDYT